MRKYRVNADSWTELLDILRNDEAFNEFDKDYLYGAHWNQASANATWSGDIRRQFAVQQKLITYVIYSYETPIAWRLTDGSWVIPDMVLSHTTSNHQSKVRTAVQVLRNGSTLGMFPQSAALHRGERARDWHNDPKHTDKV